MGLKEINKKIWLNELYRGSFILVILINIGNIINYIFQFSMARMLGPVDYGIFAVLTSLVYIFSVPTLAIQTVVSKKVTKFSINKEYPKMKGFIFDMTKKVLILSMIIFIIFTVFSFYLSKILNINVYLLILTGSFLFGAFLYPIALGFFQGMKKFNSWGLNFILSSALKLVTAVALVYIGFKVYGAIFGFIISVTLPIFFAIPEMKKVLQNNRENEKAEIFSKDSITTYLGIFLIVVIYSIDVIFARLFFPEDIVGKYAVISMIGKIIFFGTNAIASAMFPISTERHSIGNGSKDIIKKAFFATGFLCLISIIAFLIFPDPIIKILFGSQYKSLSGILFYIGIAFSFIAGLNLLVFYKISNEKFKLKHVFLLFFLVIVQIAVFYFFHQNIIVYSFAFMCFTIVMFIAGLLFIK